MKTVITAKGNRLRLAAAQGSGMPSQTIRSPGCNRSTNVAGETQSVTNHPSAGPNRIRFNGLSRGASRAFATGNQRDLSRMPAAPLVYKIIVRKAPECNGRIYNRPGFSATSALSGVENGHQSHRSAQNPAERSLCVNGASMGRAA
jgi:hypothetical protein